MITLTIILGIVFLLGLSGIRIVNQWEEGVTFFLGKYHGNKQPGLRWIWPFVQKMKKVDKRIRTLDVEPQECITKDSVTVNLDAVIYFKVTDPKKAIIDVRNFEVASYKFGQTALRDIVGKKNLDELLAKKDEIGKEIRDVIQEPTDNFGVKISNVEIKDVVLPDNMKRAMAKEAEASREKKARVIKAEGELEASKKLKAAADMLSSNAMILRQLQTWQEIGAEQNSTMILVPSELISKVPEMLKPSKPKQDK